MQRKYKLVVIVILSLFLIGGASMVIIKGVEHLRIEKQKRQKAESIKESKKEVKEQAEARQKIALWVVQHYEGKEAIEKIGVSKIYTNGIFGSAGKSVAVIINGEEKNIIDGIHLGDDHIPKEPGARFENSDYKYSNEPLLNKELNGVDVYFFKGGMYREGKILDNTNYKILDISRNGTYGNKKQYGVSNHMQAMTVALNYIGANYAKK